MNNEIISVPVKRFLLTKVCPENWKDSDLYLFRAENVVFYVGQSHLAFDRVWDHLLDGFKGHSIVGRFIWCNWPKSMGFTIELFNSSSTMFESVENDLNASERQLIHQWTPCFNVSLNSHPTPLPGYFVLPNAPFRRRRSIKALIYEAERAVMVDDAKNWLKSLE